MAAWHSWLTNWFLPSQVLLSLSQNKTLSHWSLLHIRLDKELKRGIPARFQLFSSEVSMKHQHWRPLISNHSMLFSQFVATSCEELELGHNKLQGLEGPWTEPMKGCRDFSGGLWSGRPGATVGFLVFISSGSIDSTLFLTIKSVQVPLLCSPCQPEQTVLMFFFSWYLRPLLRPLAQKGSEEENPGDRLGCLCRRRPTGSLETSLFVWCFTTIFPILSAEMCCPILWKLRRGRESREASQGPMPG